MNTYLYRLWDETDRLLYVGMSKSAIHRLHEHLTEQPWAEQVAKQTIDRYATREEAARAEADAIRSEAPLYNVVHNRRVTARQQHETVLAQHGAYQIREMQPRWTHELLHNALRSVNELVLAVGAHANDGEALAFDDFVRSLSYLPFADSCHRCFGQNGQGVAARWPIATSGDGTYTYECHICWSRWTCWYAGWPIRLSLTRQVVL